MCTTLSYRNNSNVYFGRNLDLAYHYDEEVVITPRYYDFNFGLHDNEYALIGVANVVGGYPLYYEACNEYGLYMAGLNFSSCRYNIYEDKIYNVPSYQLIPFVLRNCKTIADCIDIIFNLNITDKSFMNLKATPLHWFISDNTHSVTIEQTRNGLLLYANNMDVLTNEPSFDIQGFNLNNYHNLSNQYLNTNFRKKLDLKEYSNGMGGLGLPGDYSSMSRFVKASFVLHNLANEDTTDKDVTQVFNTLDSVKQVKGCVKVNDDYEYTVYSSVIDAKHQTLHYKTYYNQNIKSVEMTNKLMDRKRLIRQSIYTTNIPVCGELQ